MKRFLALAVIAAVSTGCGELLAPAAAVVYEEKITIDEVDVRIDRCANAPDAKRAIDQGTDAQSIRKDCEQQELSRLIKRLVYERAAERLDVPATATDVQERIDQIKADFASQSAFEEALKEQGLTLPILRELLFDQVLEENIREEVTRDVEPPEAELKAYYEEHRDDFSQTRAQHILVEEQSVAARLADQLHAAPKGQVDDLFGRLAKRFSTDTASAGKDGDLGYFAPGSFVEPFEDAARRLSIGEISDAVQTEFGWHVIRVTDRRMLSFEQARPQILDQLATQLKDRAWQDFVVDAYKDADVSVNPRYGELDLETQLVVTPSSDEFPGVEPLEEQRPLETPGD